MDLLLQATRYPMDLISWLPSSASLLDRASWVIPTQEWALGPAGRWAPFAVIPCLQAGTQLPAAAPRLLCGGC